MTHVTRYLRCDLSQRYFIFLLCFVFALAERKNRVPPGRTDTTASTMLPQAKRHLCAAPRSGCDHRLRQSGTFLPIVVRFRAASAKTNNKKWGSTVLPQA